MEAKGAEKVEIKAEEVREEEKLFQELEVVVVTLKKRKNHQISATLHYGFSRNSRQRG